MHGLLIAAAFIGAFLPASLALPSESLVYASPLLNKRSRAASSSPLVRRQAAQCYHDDDCGQQLVHGARKCLAGTCQTVCNAGWRPVGLKCKPDIQCPNGTQPFGSFCLSGPSEPLTSKRCSAATNCATGIANAFGYCDAISGKCSSICLSTFLWDGSRCVKNTVQSALCRADTDCAPGPDSSGLVGKCQSNGYCVRACAAGLELRNGICVTVQKDSCANKNCLPIMGGTARCQDGNCNYTCSQPGAVPICSGSSCQCINAASDVLNCGPRHLVCPTPPLAYQLGDQALPACVNGVCTLRCASGSAVFYSPLGQAYCPRRRQRQRAL